MITTLNNTPLNIFYAYDQKDKLLCDEMRKHLAQLQRQRIIAGWHEYEILPGTDRRRAIHEHLINASIILLFISSDFLASDYWFSKEMQFAFERHKAGLTYIIPLLLRPVDWAHSPFAHLQYFPRNGKPVATWKNRDQAFVEIVQELCLFIPQLQNAQQESGEVVSTHPSQSSSKNFPEKSLEEAFSPKVASFFPRAFPTIWTVPFRQNPFFMYRQHVLDTLHQLFFEYQSTTTIPVIAITGPAGIGKTQLATEYAFRYREDYKEAVLWIRADTQEALVTNFVTFVRSYVQDIRTEEIQDQHVLLATLQRWWREHSSWLLILDNADDLSFIGDFLPRGGRGHILLTTRALATGDLADSLELDSLSQFEAAHFLLVRAKLVKRNTQLQALPTEAFLNAQKVAVHMGNLPLALDQAAAYIEETACGVQGYLQLYETYRPGLLKERGGPAPEYKTPVALVWEVSKQYIRQRNPAAIELLHLCAFLYPDAIPEGVITQGAFFLGPVLQPAAANPFAFNEVVKILRSFSLLDRDAERHVLTIHPLVQTVLKDAMDVQTQRIWAERTIQSVQHVFSHLKQSDDILYQQLIPQVHVCALLITQWNIYSTDAFQLLYRVGRYFQDQKQFEQAEHYYMQAVNVYQHVPTVNQSMLLDLQRQYALLQKKK